jgi:hypothetical protein
MMVVMVVVAPIVPLMGGVGGIGGGERFGGGHVSRSATGVPSLSLACCCTVCKLCKILC